MNVLITGANGFVGSALIATLEKANSKMQYQVRKAVRGCDNASVQDRVVTVGDINAHTNWQQALQGIDVVVHLAARVHVMHENALDPLDMFRKVNVEGTLNLAHQAVAAGVKRFIFVSTAKVNGEFTHDNKPFQHNDTPNPQDAYAISKYEAELGLAAIAQSTQLEVVIIRPPLIYGNGVRANFANMMKLVKLGVPLPFGAIKNKRSLLYVGNLASFIEVCLAHPNAANQTFLVSDGEDVSLTSLLSACADAMHKKRYLIPIPQSWLAFGLSIIGKENYAQRLFGNLQIDHQHACNLLNWSPPYTMAEGLFLTFKPHSITQHAKTNL